MLAHYLKTIFIVFRDNNHSDFLNFSDSYITEFFDNKSSNYNKPEFFKSAHKLGDYFKRFYTVRNEEGHFFRDSGIVEILYSLESVIITYLYIIMTHQTTGTELGLLQLLIALVEYLTGGSRT